MSRSRFPACAALVGAAVALPASAQTCEPHWSDEFWAVGPPGEGRAVLPFDDGRGPSLFIGTAHIGTERGWLARWDGNRLELIGQVAGAMPNSVLTGVYALAGFDDGTGTALYVGGSFTQAGGVPAHGVARWDGEVWSAVGPGTDRSARALAVFDDGAGPGLYAAGYFQSAGAAAASCVAKWDGHEWTALGSGLGGGASAPGSSFVPVGSALAVFDDGSGPSLFVGGNFSLAGGAPVASVARWRGDSWEPVGNGLFWLTQQGSVLSLKVLDAGLGPSLYAGGVINFGGFIEKPQVARWDGTTWWPVGLWLRAPWVQALAAFDAGAGPALYAGTYNKNAWRFDGGPWTGIGQTLNGPVRALAEFDDGGGSRLYAAGQWLNGYTSSHSVARWNGEEWSSLPSGGSQEPVQRVKVLHGVSGPELYALNASAIAGQSVGSIARFDGETWHAAAPAGQVLANVADVEMFDSGAGPMLHAAASLVVGSTTYRVVRLNAGLWEPVGAPTPQVFPGYVTALRTFDDGVGPRLFAGGSNVRAWDGKAWSPPLAAGLPPPSLGIRDFEALDAGEGPRLYMAWAGGVHRWNGAVWQPVGALPPQSIADLHVFDEGSGPRLFVSAAAAVYRLDGNVWSPMPYADAKITSLAAFDDGTGPALYAGGEFNTIGGVTAARIARWRGGTWSGLGGPTEGTVKSMAVFHLPSPSLWVGGAFSVMGGTSSVNLARWVGCPSCYPDCDSSGTLTSADFGCFQARFAAHQPYADCNADRQLTISDFGCFQSAFVTGCP